VSTEVRAHDFSLRPTQEDQKACPQGRPDAS